MRYSELTLMDRKAIFDHQENFPLVVTVDGQTTELNKEAVADLRIRRVDFDIDEAQVSRILINFGTC